MQIAEDRRRTSPITERMSRERIDLLARANTHGKKFFATGGSHVCSDDFFKAQALLAREEDVTIHFLRVCVNFPQLRFLGCTHDKILPGSRYTMI